MRFLIDECLTVDLVTVAGKSGHEAQHVAHVGRAGWKDWNVVRYARGGDFVLVTNNASDFRQLYAAQQLHAGLIKIDLRQPRREIAASMRDLRRARRMVVSDPEILGGDPVFRGTRVPVHMVAQLGAQGSSLADLIEGYPRLTAEMIRLAPIYANAYPLRGPRRKLPWSDQQPVRRGRRRLDTIAVS